MAHHGPSALPPTTVLSTQTISQSAAHEFLAAYLDRATNDPSLQPNATISETGPVSRTTAAAPNLTLHNLKRVQAGLAGEFLGRDLTVAKQNPGEDYLDIAAGVVPGSNQENEGDENDVQMKESGFEGEAEAFEDQEAQQASLDKEERKRKKKERRAAEKKAKAKKANDSE